MTNKIQLVGLFVLLSSTLQAAPLTRPVKIEEGVATKLYLGTDFGQTLYTFDLDKDGKSACNQVCAERWPPLLVSAEEAKTLTEPYGTITRDSGLLQVTYQSKPIYTFYLDHTEGDNKGDGLGGVWHDIELESKDAGSQTH